MYKWAGWYTNERRKKGGDWGSAAFNRETQVEHMKQIEFPTHGVRKGLCVKVPMRNSIKLFYSKQFPHNEHSPREAVTTRLVPITL